MLKKDFGKFTSCMTFGAHKLVHSEPFLDYRYEFWHWLSALCSDVQKIFLYRCTSTVSALNYCGRIFFQNPQLSIRSGAYKLLHRFFWIFAIVDRNFANIVAPPGDGNVNYVVYLKEQSILKKRWNPSRNRAINGCTKLVRTMQPSNARCSGLGARQTNKKHHIFAPRPTAGAHCAIFPKLCMVIELVVPIKKGAIHFLIQRIVFLEVHGKIRPNWPTRGFSAITQ